MTENGADGSALPPSITNANPATGGPGGVSSDPSSFLSEIIGGPIVVKLNSGVEYRGELSSVDGYMNIALEKTEEYVAGKLRNRYGDVFIRGNNGLFYFSYLFVIVIVLEVGGVFWVLNRRLI
jgi:U6 snRNA-associated Sm-like protein LSm6